MTLSPQELGLSDLSQQRLAWRARHLEWLLPRIAGDGADKDQFLQMWSAALDEAFNEGTEEAADLVARIRQSSDRPGFAVIERSILDLARRNRGRAKIRGTV